MTEAVVLINRGTGVLLGALLALLIAWECVTLVGRKMYGWRVRTVSMALRDNRHRLTGIVFAMSGMVTHWWFPTFPTWTVGAVVFWVLALGLLAWDVAWWKRPVGTWPRWAQTVKDSRWWVLAGLVAGLTLFPQGA